MPGDSEPDGWMAHKGSPYDLRDIFDKSLACNMVPFVANCDANVLLFLQRLQCVAFFAAAQWRSFSLPVSEADLDKVAELQVEMST